ACSARIEKGAHFLTNRLADERRHGVADEAELMRARDREAEPIGEALHARGFARSERALLRGMDEAQAVLAEMRDDGGAKALAMHGAMRGASDEIVFALFLASAGGERWKIADGIPQFHLGVILRATRRTQLAGEVAGDVAAHADEKLPPPALRHAEFPRFLD